jgi:hypothetical protein
VVEEVSVGALFVRTAAGDDVEQQAVGGQALERGCGLRGHGRQHEARTKSHQRLQFAGVLRHRDRHQPRVLAVRSGGDQGAEKAGIVGGDGHLLQVLEFTRSCAAVKGAAREVAAVAVGRKIPEEIAVHDLSCITA